MKRVIVLGLAMVAAGCAKRPTAVATCEKLAAAGVATGCRAGSLGVGLVAAASERVEFSIAESNKTGQAFASAADYESTIKAFDGAAELAGRHRYGSPSALIFVQLNSEASPESGNAAKRVVDGL
jgi:hypothetical protein